MNAAIANMPFQPRQDSAGGVRAFVLAAIIHVLLFVFLYFGISWQNKPPAPAEAELWTALPPPSAPQPRVEPRPEPKPEPKPVIEEPKPTPPPPVKADIEQKIEKKKPEPKKEPPKKEEPKKEPPKKEPPKKEEAKKDLPKAPPIDDIKEQLAKEDRQRERDRFSKMAQDEMRASSSAGSSNEWASKVAAIVRGKIPINIVNTVPANAVAVFEVTLLPGREVGFVKLVKSSGYPAYDEAAAQAIQASSPLPPPTPGMRPLDRVITFEAKPK